MAASSHYGGKVANTKILKVGLGNMTLHKNTAGTTNTHILESNT